jgi:hypothetical protein
LVTAPDAIAPSVPIEHGTMIMPACGCEPDEGFAAMLSSRWIRNIFPFDGNPIQSPILFSSAARRSKPSSTIATVLAESETIKLIRSTTPLAARWTSVRWA